MTLTVPVTHKFACLSFKNVFCKYGGGPIQLANDLSVYVRPRFSLDTQWLGMLCAIDHETLGSLDHEKLTNSNFLILATAPTTTPNHGNDDNERLIERTLHLFHGILMHGVPHHEDGLLLSGANVDDRVQVQTLQPLPTYYSWRNHLLENGPYDLDEKIIKSAGVVAQGLSLVESQSGDFCRLKRGIHAWVRAVQERSYFDRLHEFVRATEALLKPKQGETRKHFIYRCKTLAGDDQQTGNLLGEIYDLRSAAEHLNDWELYWRAFHKTSENNMLVNERSRLNSWQDSLTSGCFHAQTCENISEVMTRSKDSGSLRILSDSNVGEALLI